MRSQRWACVQLKQAGASLSACSPGKRGGTPLHEAIAQWNQGNFACSRRELNIIWDGGVPVNAEDMSKTLIVYPFLENCHGAPLSSANNSLWLRVWDVSMSTQTVADARRPCRPDIS